MKFASFSVKLEMLRNTKNLAGSQFREDENFPLEIRKTRRSSNPYLKDAKKLTQDIFDKEAGSGKANIRPGLCGKEYSARSRGRWFGHPCED